MVIGIDVRVLTGGRRSGVEEYTERLLEHMLPLDSEIEYRLFFSSATSFLPPYQWRSLENVHVVERSIPNRVLLSAARFANIPKLDMMLGGVDVFFSPHFILAPLTSGCRQVITFHDLSFERFPEFFSIRRRIWHRIEMRPREQAKRADAIIAVSDFTGLDLEKLYGVESEKVSRIYSGISPDMIPFSDKTERKLFMKEKKLPEKYIFFLGTFEPRKNIRGLVKAYNAFRDKGKYSDTHLVIGGTSGWLCYDIFREIEQSPYRRAIHAIGTISDEDRNKFYSCASMFVYPSFFEGFGFPPLEAMACGTPVIASHMSSLPEVVGSAGILVNPHNPTEISVAMEAVLTNMKLRKSLIEKGFERTKLFSWDRCARETLDVLVRAAENVDIV